GVAASWALILGLRFFGSFLFLRLRSVLLFRLRGFFGLRLFIAGRVGRADQFGQQTAQFRSTGVDRNDLAFLVDQIHRGERVRAIISTQRLGFAHLFVVAVEQNVPRDFALGDKILHRFPFLVLADSDHLKTTIVIQFIVLLDVRQFEDAR